LHFQNKIKQTDFILLHTGWSRFWSKEDYLLGFPSLDLEAAKYLSDFALKGVGVDAISFDHPDSKDFPVHKILLSAGFVLIENLTLIENLPIEGFVFSCFPLKIKHGDGSPVRAVGIIRDEKSLKK
jgi:arylformamidase